MATPQPSAREKHSITLLRTLYETCVESPTEKSETLRHVL
jgi:hypothetical protein